MLVRLIFRLTLLLLLALPAALACRSGISEPGLWIGGPEGEVPAGTLFQFRAPEGMGITWKTSDATVASITDGGLLWAKTPGEVTVSASTDREVVSSVVTVGPLGSGKVIYWSKRALWSRTMDGGHTAKILAVAELCSVVRIAVSPNGRSVALACSDRKAIQVVSLDGEERVEIADAYGLALAFASDASLLYSMGSEVWAVDLATMSKTLVWSAADEEPREDGAIVATVVGAFEVLPDGETLIFSGRTKGFPYDERLGVNQSMDSLYVAQLGALKQTRTAIAEPLGRDPTNGSKAIPAPTVIFERASADPEGQRILVTMNDGVFVVSLREEPESIEQIPVNVGEMWVPDFSPTGTRAVSVHTHFTELDLGLRVWNLQSNEIEAEISTDAGSYSHPHWTH